LEDTLASGERGRLKILETRKKKKRKTREKRHSKPRNGKGKEKRRTNALKLNKKFSYFGKKKSIEGERRGTLGGGWDRVFGGGPQGISCPKRPEEFEEGKSPR